MMWEQWVLICLAIAAGMLYLVHTLFGTLCNTLLADESKEVLKLTESHNIAVNNIYKITITTRIYASMVTILNVYMIYMVIDGLSPGMKLSAAIFNTYVIKALYDADAINSGFKQLFQHYTEL